MRRNSVAVVAAIALIGLAGVARAAEQLPYSEGHVWAITLIHVKPGMINPYMREIVPLRNAFVEGAKRQGELIDSHIVVGDASSYKIGIL